MMQEAFKLLNQIFKETHASESSLLNQTHNIVKSMWLF